MKKISYFGFVLVFLFLGWSIPPTGLAAEKPLVVGFEGDAATLDPHARNETTTTTIQRHTYEQLISLDANLKIQPDLAESWKLIDDNTWEFKLRKGVKFHNGEPFNAAVAKYSLERCKTHPKSQYKYMVPDYKEIVAVDEYTLRYVTKTPTPELLIMLESVSMVPPKYFTDTEYGKLATTMVGTGPYKFVEWVKYDHITLVRNENWHRSPKPDFEKVILRPIPENATRVAALITGEIDACWGVSIPDIPRVEKNKNTYVSRCPSQRVIYVMFDLHSEKGGPAPNAQPGLPAGKPNPFKDIRVRKAIAHAINADDIIKFVMEGSAYPASQMVSSYATGFNPAIKRPKYDLALAKKLLAEAGYPNGFEANIDTPNDRYINDQQVTEAIGAQLAKIGLRLKVVATPKAVFFPKVDRYESPFFLAGWGTLSWQGTMNGFFREKKGSYGRTNRGRFSDPELGKKMDVANSIMDDAKREKLRDEISAKIYATYYVIPLYYQENVFGFSRRIKNAKARVDERLFAHELKKAE
ncbi:MAG: ABC transporter substrate-binding protein [Deltaproteobacteria bacterium]|nr:ABC transporter substrate-binding protein [Deltaproteobacteria bacterium]